MKDSLESCCLSRFLRQEFIAADRAARVAEILIQNKSMGISLLEADNVYGFTPKIPVPEAVDKEFDRPVPPSALVLAARSFQREIKLVVAFMNLISQMIIVLQECHREHRNCISAFQCCQRIDG
jgi:hypothetical protein